MLQNAVISANELRRAQFNRFLQGKIHFFPPRNAECNGELKWGFSFSCQMRVCHDSDGFFVDRYNAGVEFAACAIEQGDCIAGFCPQHSGKMVAATAIGAGRSDAGQVRWLLESRVIGVRFYLYPHWKRRRQGSTRPSGYA